MKLKLTINKHQAQEIASALELQSRLLSGQFQELERLFMLRNFNIEDVDYALKQLKILIFPELMFNESYGIGNKEVDKRVIDDYDIYKQILYELHKDDSVWSVHSTPHLLCREENKITIDE